MFGEQVVAAEMLSWRNDRRAGQWLLLHTPFKTPKDFWRKDIDDKVPHHLRYLAMARECWDESVRNFWRSAPLLRREMEQEGKSN
eukprot:12415608-Karenia_brevis.AAC.2